MCALIVVMHVIDNADGRAATSGARQLAEGALATGAPRCPGSTGKSHYSGRLRLGR